MADLYQAGAKLGDMLLGNSGQAAYTEQLGKEYQAQERMAKARQERSKMIAREALPAAIKADPVLGQRADLASAILGMAEGQPNLGTYTGGLGDLGDLALDTQREEAAKAGDYRRLNVLTAIKADKNYEPVVSEDGNLRPSGVALGDEAFRVQPLPQTQATIAQKGKQGDAALIRANKPPASRARGGGSKPSTASSEAQVLADARSAIASGASVASVKQRLKDRGYSKLAGKL